MKNVMFLLVILIAFLPSKASADDCTQALIVTTYKNDSSSRYDWRIAKHVTEETYKDLKKDIGASGKIFGVPVGANYNEFQTNISKLELTYSERLTVDQARSVLWTGLSSTSVSAYSLCLRAKVLAGNGLQVAVLAATDTQLELLVKWVVPGFPRATNVVWSPKSIGSVTLPTKLETGEVSIIVDRPASEILVTANTRGYTSRAIRLTPLPKAAPPIPEAPCVRANLRGECLVCRGRLRFDLGATGGTDYECPNMAISKGYKAHVWGSLRYSSTGSTTGAGGNATVHIGLLGPGGGEGRTATQNLYNIEKRGAAGADFDLATPLSGNVTRSPAVRGDLHLAECGDSKTGNPHCETVPDDVASTPAYWQICTSEVSCARNLGMALPFWE